jgi:hypothetical protein
MASVNLCHMSADVKLSLFNMFSISLVVRFVYLVLSYYWYIKYVITNKAMYSTYRFAITILL